MRDALLIGPWHHEDDRSLTYRRTPNDYEAEHILLRTIRCVSGEVQTIMDCEPVLDYGRAHVRWEYTGDELPPGPGDAPTAPTSTLTLTTDMRLGFEGGQASTRTLLKEGDVRFVALSWGGAVPPTDLRRRLQAAGVDRPPLAALAGPRPVPRPPVAQLPAAQRADAQGAHLRADRRHRGGGQRPRCRRRPGGDRNYDYRFTWIRDATFALWGMYSLGFDWEARRLLLLHRRHRRAATTTCRSCTASAASASSTEYELDHLPGYADSRPVRIGNAAYAQQQHDVWGALLDSVYLHSKAADHLDNRIWPILDKQVGEALKHWREPDAGIWEVRGELQHFTSSKIMCWVAVDRGARLAAHERARTARPPSGSWRPRRSRTTSSPTASTSAASSPSTTAARRSTPRCCSPRCVRFLPRGRPAHPRHRAGDPRRADRRRPGAALQGRGDRRRLQRRGGHVHDLLVLAGLGAVRDRRVPARPASSARSCCRSPVRSSSTARRSTRTPASTWATSRRPSPTWR